MSKPKPTCLENFQPNAGPKALSKQFSWMAYAWVSNRDCEPKKKTQNFSTCAHISEWAARGLLQKSSLVIFLSVWKNVDACYIFLKASAYALARCIYFGGAFLFGDFLCAHPFPLFWPLRLSILFVSFRIVQNREIIHTSANISASHHPRQSTFTNMPQFYLHFFSSWMKLVHTKASGGPSIFIRVELIPFPIHK